MAYPSCPCKICGLEPEECQCPDHWKCWPCEVGGECFHDLFGYGKVLSPYMNPEFPVQIGWTCEFESINGASSFIVDVPYEECLYSIPENE